MSFIKLNTAKLAKEKGYWSEKVGFCDNYINNRNQIFERCEDDFIFPCPTQSVLRKWFRDNHKIFISIIYHKTRKHSIILNDECENTIGDCFGEYFNTYEEALERALQESLTLIK